MTCVTHDVEAELHVGPCALGLTVLVLGAGSLCAHLVLGVIVCLLSEQAARHLVILALGS
jgi:hypothetical protein